MTLRNVGTISAWSISVLAWGLSYVSQVQLGLSDGRLGSLAYIWPLTVDLASLSAMVYAVVLARQGRSTLMAWAIALISAAVMIAANVASAWGSALAVAMHAWPPIIALLNWILLVHVGRQGARAGSEDQQSKVPEPIGQLQIDSPGQRTPRTRPPAQRSGASRRAREFELIAQMDGKLTGERVAAELGCSTATARRRLSEWKAQPNGAASDVDLLSPEA